MNATEQITVEDAQRRLRAEYWDDVRVIVEDAKRAIKDKEIDDEDGLSDWLHETVDGHGRVIYTGRAIEGLLYTDNEDAYTDDFGTEGIVRDGSINWSGLAYAYLMADVRYLMPSWDELTETLPEKED